MSEHTPTPWEYDKTGKFYSHDGVIRMNGVIICRMTPSMVSIPTIEETEANARHIVKCVNLHVELVAALKVIMDNLGWVAPSKGFCIMSAADFVKIKQALAKAEEVVK